MDKAISFTEHLDELRSFFLKSLYFFIAAFAFSFYLSDELMAFVQSPIVKVLQKNLIFLHPGEKLIAYLKVSFLAAFIFSAPWIFYQAWIFISQGLYKNERSLLKGLAFLASLFCFSGFAFAYFVVVPLSLKFLLFFGDSTLEPMISLKAYISFFISFCFAFIFAFETPIFLLALAYLGIIDNKDLKRFRLYAYPLLALLAALFTPPDIFSQILLFVPLVLLYELSIFLTRFFIERPVKKET